MKHFLSSLSLISIDEVAKFVRFRTRATTLDQLPVPLKPDVHWMPHGYFYETYTVTELAGGELFLHLEEPPPWPRPLNVIVRAYVP